MHVCTYNLSQFQHFSVTFTSFLTPLKNRSSYSDYGCRKPLSSSSCSINTRNTKWLPPETNRASQELDPAIDILGFICYCFGISFHWRTMLLSLLFRITNAKNVLKIKSQKYDLEENNEIWNEEVTADNLDIQAEILWVLLQTCARMFAVLKPSCYFYP